jgi:hypothetical protein
MKKIFLLIAVVVALAACTTKTGDTKKKSRDPLAALSEMSEFEALAPGAQVYLSIDDVPGARAVLDLLSFGGASGKDAAQILNRTHSLKAAVYPAGSPQRFLAVARGAYPKTLADFSLAVAANWKKAQSDSGVSFWRSEKDGLAVAFNAQWALASDTDPVTPVLYASVPGTVAPRGFAAFREGSLMVGWLGNAATLMNAFFTAQELPFEIQADMLFFSVVPSGSAYETLLRIETPSGAIASSLVQLFSFVRLFTAGADETSDPALWLLKVLFAAPPKQDGVYLNLRIGPLSAKETALLFNTFSVYSKPVSK